MTTEYKGRNRFDGDNICPKCQGLMTEKAFFGHLFEKICECSKEPPPKTIEGETANELDA